LLTTITNDARICFGIKHVKSKDQHDAVLDDLLNTATTHAPINHILADKEFYDGSVIDVFRKHVGPEWIIKAVDTDPVEEFIRVLPTDMPGIHRNFGITSATPNPNAFAIPDNFTGQETLLDVRKADLQQASEDQHTLTDFGTADTHKELIEQQPLRDAQDAAAPQDAGGSTTSHTVYLTDMDDEQTTVEFIDSLYGDRWSIEPAIKHIKLNFHPVCESRNRKLRIYFANIAVLFFNWHALINRALSPQYNLPLDVSHHELLTAIREVALTEKIEGHE
jgi:IS4 transposase